MIYLSTERIKLEMNLNCEKGENKMEIEEKLLNFIERIEKLEEEKKELTKDVREIFSEAKGNGYDTKVMREILKLRKMTQADRAESEFLREEYKKKLGIEE